MKIIFTSLPFIALALLSCAGNKPVANADDDPRCNDFYKVIEIDAKKYEVSFSKNLKSHKMPIPQGYDKDNPERVCIETILCNKTEYCAVAMALPDSLEMNFLHPEDR